MPVSDLTNERLELVAGTSRTGAQGVARFAVYAGLGGTIGLLVAVLEWITVHGLLERIVEAPLAVQVVAPGIGLAVAAIILRLAWRTTNATSDAYVRAFHGKSTLETKRLGPKLAAAIATIGSGGALGLEGPSVYAGSMLGQFLDNRHLNFLHGRSTRRILLVAGAAAGVAAIFRAPATGVLFALEAPYRRDVARHALIPALVASSVSYLVFVFLLGSERLFTIGPADFSLTEEVFGAVVLGFVSGGAARLLANIFHWAKESHTTVPLRLRVPISAVISGVLVAIVSNMVDHNVALGPAAEAIADIALDPSITVWTILVLFVLRAVLTSAGLAAGGVGGVFVPLVVQGLLLGRIVGDIFDAPTNGLFPVIGLAAVLGAGYRTPLAAVMFVAETTGRAEFVIPALLATAVSQSLMGEVSVSSGQVSERQGVLEQRLQLPVDAVAITGVPVFAPGESLLGVIDAVGANPASPAVAVADEDGYRGLLSLNDIASALHDIGLEATVGDAMKDVPPVSAGTEAIEAARTMNLHNTAAVAVIDADGAPMGVVSALSLTGFRDIASD